MKNISPHYFFLISLNEFWKIFVRTVTKLIPKYIRVMYFNAAVPWNPARSIKYIQKCYTPLHPILAKKPRNCSSSPSNCSNLLKHSQVIISKVLSHEELGEKVITTTCKYPVLIPTAKAYSSSTTL